MSSVAQRKSGKQISFLSPMNSISFFNLDDDLNNPMNKTQDSSFPFDANKFPQTGDNRQSENLNKLKIISKIPRKLSLAPPQTHSLQVPAQENNTQANYSFNGEKLRQANVRQNKNSISPTKPKRKSSPQQEQFQPLPQILLGEDEAKNSIQKISLSNKEQKQLKSSLSLISPTNIDHALRKLREINKEEKSSKPLANPSVLQNNCIDEDEILQNIKGIAHELHSIYSLQFQLNSDLQNKIEFDDTMLYQEMMKSPKKKSNTSRLFYEADLKEEKIKNLQRQKEEKIRQRQNQSIMNAKSQQILNNKEQAYIKIQDRVSQIIAVKQRKIEKISIIKKLEQDAHSKTHYIGNEQNPIFNKSLDFSISHEYNQENRPSIQFQNENIVLQDETEEILENNSSDNQMHSYMYQPPEQRQVFQPANIHNQANEIIKKGSNKYTQRQMQEFLERMQKKQSDMQDTIVQQKLKKEQQEMSQATFRPQINKKSQQLAKQNTVTNKLSLLLTSIFVLKWKPIEERVEKLQTQQEERRKKQEEAERLKFFHQPLINRKSSMLATRNSSRLSKSLLNTSQNLLKTQSSLSMRTNVEMGEGILSFNQKDISNTFSFNKQHIFYEQYQFHFWYLLRNSPPQPQLEISHQESLNKSKLSNKNSSNLAQGKGNMSMYTEDYLINPKEKENISRNMSPNIKHQKLKRAQTTTPSIQKSNSQQDSFSIIQEEKNNGGGSSKKLGKQSEQPIQIQQDDHFILGMVTSKMK